MRKSLLEIIRDPKTLEPLSLHVFDSRELMPDGGEDVIDGILLNNNSNRAYPIMCGVPTMLESAFSDEFLRKYKDRISTISPKTIVPPQAVSHWSFSSEWGEHFNCDLRKTWGWTIEERVEQFFLETNADANCCKRLMILDAGCGNGQLSQALSDLGATVVALDYSTSVFDAERRRKSESVHFIQGDLQQPPFDAGTFDLIISNGVLHHTPDTYKTFVQVAKLAKQGGRFYLWLYRKPERFLRRLFFYPVLELTRSVVSRLPVGPQKAAVKAYASALLAMHKISRKHRDLSWPERIVSAYDNLTPTWRHCHTPLEVSCWFFMNGYSAPTITHWDNPYGFGMLAIKTSQEHTPGANFGKTGAVSRYWQ